MAKNSIQAITNDISAAMIYLQAIQASKLKQENQRLADSIEELLADVLVQAQIIEQHLIDRENMIDKLKGSIVNIEDDLDSEEYEMKERSTPLNRSSKVAGQSSKTEYRQPLEAARETPLNIEEIISKETPPKP